MTGLIHTHITAVIASRYKRRGDPGSLDLPFQGMKAKVKHHIPLRGTKALEYYNGFVANAPRNDDPIDLPDFKHKYVA